MPALLVVLAVWAGASAPANAVSDGIARLQAQSAETAGRADVREPTERAGGSLPGAVGWVALGLGIAVVIVVIGLSNSEIVSE